MHHIKPAIRKPNKKQSLGKGFSRTEIAKAGLDKVQARRFGFPVDEKRQRENKEAVGAHQRRCQAYRAELKRRVTQDLGRGRCQSPQ